VQIHEGILTINLIVLCNGMSEMTILLLPQTPPCFLVLAELSFYNLLIVSKQVTRNIIVKLEKADAYNVAQKKARDFVSLRRSNWSQNRSG
jgi:hypothetical protein